MESSSHLSPVPSQDAAPTPEAIWENINAYQRTAALRAAVELELFTKIGEGAQTADALAASAQASRRGIRILSDYLVVIGLLNKEGERYHLTPDSAAFLSKKSPAYLGGSLKFINSPDLMAGFNDLAETVRKGTTILKGSGVVDAEDPIWVEFARSMVPHVMPAAGFLAQVVSEGGSGALRVLDIAAGHGLFGITVARTNPNAEITALDWKPVLEVAKENAAAAGVQERYHWLPGDAFTVDFAGAYDVVLVTNFFHHFETTVCETLMRKIHACLKPGGRAITLEFIPNDDRVSPAVPATFSLTMLAATPAGDAYTFREFDGMFRAAGFQRSEMRQVPNSPQRVVVSWRE